MQGFQLNERWSFYVGLDQTETILQPEARPFDSDRELVSGSFNEDFVAVYTGALYNADLWSANARLEYRDADSEQRTALLFGWYREPSIGHGLSAGMLAYRSESPDGTEMTAADMRFGWAYRMADGKWSFLNRVDLVYEDTVLTADDLRTWRIIFASASVDVPSRLRRSTRPSPRSNTSAIRPVPIRVPGASSFTIRRQ